MSNTTTRRYNAPTHPAAQLLRCQYLYSGTSKESNLPSTGRACASERIVGHPLWSKRQPSNARQSQQRRKLLLRCQYLYFCASKASKLSVSEVMVGRASRGESCHGLLTCQYLYFFTSKASKLSTSQGSVRRLCDKLSERKCTSCFNPRPRSTLSWFPCTNKHAYTHTHTHTHTSAYLNTCEAFFII